MDDQKKPISFPLERKNFSLGKKITKYALPPYFSFTQLSAYQKCPLQYKFAHILKIPIEGKPSLTFGKVMHKTLEEFLKTNCKIRGLKQENLFDQKEEKLKILPFEELLKIYKKNWVDDWYQNKEEKERYYKQGEKSLKEFYENFKRTNPKIKLIEGKPALETSFSLKIGSYKFIGKIDRIDEVEGNKVKIIDYKTGQAKDKLDQGAKQQLLIYQIAAEKILKLKPVELTYYYLNKSIKRSFLGNETDKQKIKEKIIETIDKIKNNEFKPTPGWQCQFCDFKDICPYRSKSNY